MCELLGICGTNKTYANDLLKEFYSHSVSQPNGWGLAILEEDGASIEKEPVRAIDSSYLEYRLKSKINVKNLIAHIRYATFGQQKYENCHPFSRRDNFGRCWTLAHNGTIFSAPPLDPYFNQQEGQTDSERILLYFIDRINKKQLSLKRPLEKNERFSLLDGLICELAPRNKLNILLFDGEMMYVHTNYAHTLYAQKTENAAILSTKPFGNAHWEELLHNTLLAYQAGQQIFTGTSHGHEYFDSEADRKLIARRMAEMN